MQSVAVYGGQFHIRPAQNTEHSLSVKSPSKVQQNLDFQSMQEHETHHENDLHFVETLAEAVVQAHWAAVVADCFPELELVEAACCSAGGSYCLLRVNANTAIPPRIKIIAIKPNEGLLLGAVFSGSRGFSFLDDLLIAELYRSSLAKAQVRKE